MLYKFPRHGFIFERGKIDYPFPGQVSLTTISDCIKSTTNCENDDAQAKKRLRVEEAPIYRRNEFLRDHGFK